MELVPLGKFEVTPYRISTMTVTGSINSNIDLQKLFDHIDIESYDNIKYMEYGANKNEHHFKGELAKKNKKQQKKRFDNQMTLHMYDDKYKYNIKLFKNGNVQMTGVKDVIKGKNIVDELIKILKINNKTCKDDEKIVLEEDKMKNTNFDTRLINCDFKVSYKINRGLLHKLLTHKYGMTCSYEPCIYQGVKLSFFMNDYSNNGICSCAKKCLGKGANTICKKITVAIFQSGCVTITGSNDISQLNYVYNFMTDLLEENMEDVYQHTYRLKNATESPTE